MQLEDLTAEVRPRTHWEAVDLGFALVRRHFPRLLLAWLLCIGPLWAVLLLLTRWVPVGLIVFVIWWLKPIYGRLPLFHLSRALFGATPRGFLRTLLPSVLDSRSINGNRGLGSTVVRRVSAT